jgi:iron complex outermembrane receptor protein
MTKTAMRMALCLTTSLASIAAMPALAQESGAAAADQDSGEIIVTARRVEERLQDVPASIVVFNQQSLDNKNVTSVQDLATFAPSLSVNSRFGSKAATFSLRGFSQASRTAASVGVYFADVVAPRGGDGGTPSGDGAGPGAFFDLENVQVVNGPQGTLFGRNTTGGAIIFVPRRPTDRVEGYVEATYGNYENKRLQGVVNLPISDAVRLRVGADWLDRDGYIRNISGVGPSRYGDQNYIAGRASLLIDFSPEIENYTIGTYSHSEDNGVLPRVTDCQTNAANPLGVFPFGLLSCQQIARGVGKGFYTAEGAFTDPSSRSTQWQVINTTTWMITDGLTLKNIASYSQVRNAFVMDVLGANFVIPTGAFGPIPNTGAAAGRNFSFAASTRAPGRNNNDQQNFVEELRLQGESGDNLIWQAGAYYERSSPRKASGTQAPNVLACTNSDTFQCTDLIGPFIRRSAGFVNVRIGESYFLNKALYGQATYTLADNLKLTGGLRYTWDRTRGVAEIRAYRVSSATGAPLAVPAVTCVLATADANCRTDTTQKSKAPTWLLGVDYNPVDDVLLYAKYTRGYRQGAVSTTTPPPYQSFGPEKVDAFEVGAKASWEGAVPGHFNVAGFYNSLQNQQLSVSLSSSTNATTPTSTNLNAGKSEITGVEVEASVRPLPGFTIDGNLEYLHTRVKSLVVSDVPSGIYDVIRPTATVGSRLPFVPTWKWNLTGTYQLPVSEDVGRISLSATYSKATSIMYSVGPFGTLPGLGLLSVNFNWKAVGGSPVDISIYGNNLTKEKYFTGVTDLLASGGFVSKYLGEPRTYGIRVRYSFGR